MLRDELQSVLGALREVELKSEGEDSGLKGTGSSSESSSCTDFPAKFDRFRTGEALEDLMQRSLS